jgi:hypothetical protein
MEVDRDSGMMLVVMAHCDLMAISRLPLKMWLTHAI